MEIIFSINYSKMRDSEIAGNSTRWHRTGLFLCVGGERYITKYNKSASLKLITLLQISEFLRRDSHTRCCFTCSVSV